MCKVAFQSDSTNQIWMMVPSSPVSLRWSTLTWAINTSYLLLEKCEVALAELPDNPRSVSLRRISFHISCMRCYGYVVAANNQSLWCAAYCCCCPCTACQDACWDHPAASVSRHSSISLVPRAAMWSRRPAQGGLASFQISWMRGRQVWLGDVIRVLIPSQERAGIRIAQIAVGDFMNLSPIQIEAQILILIWIQTAEWPLLPLPLTTCVWVEQGNQSRLVLSWVVRLVF